MDRASSDFLAFRFRLRHDRLLRLRLRRARHQATIELAKELGFSITLAELSGKCDPVLPSGEKGVRLGLVDEK
jgi:hypothetical protein